MGILRNQGVRDIFEAIGLSTIKCHRAPEGLASIAKAVLGKSEEQGIYPHPIPCQSCPVLAWIPSVSMDPLVLKLAVSLLLATFCSQV